VGSSWLMSGPGVGIREPLADGDKALNMPLPNCLSSNDLYLRPVNSVMAIATQDMAVANSPATTEPSRARFWVLDVAMPSAYIRCDSTTE
jgi:hypothetical protein